MSIGTALVASAAIGAGGSMLAGRSQSKGAEAAAALHAEATRESIAEQRRQFDITREDFAPYRDVGQIALQEFAALYGVGRNGLIPLTRADAASQPQQTAAAAPTSISWQPAVRFEALDQGQAKKLRDRGLTVAPYDDDPHWGKNDRADTRMMYRIVDPFSMTQTGGTAVASGGGASGSESPVSRSMEEARSRFMETPGYQFRFSEGVRALDRSAAARGGLRSGAHERGLVRYGQGIATDEFTNYSNALARLAGVGQSATGSTSAAGQASANAISNALMTGASGQGNALMNAATARASGYAGVANAATGAVNNFFAAKYLGMA